ncbi:hypothetical protein C8J56DRAFT_1058091 [Mycena floridula]|nr:hypothetical protein C8J56DRAFT_1058091 [Mycena floridula]
MSFDWARYTVSGEGAKDFAEGVKKASGVNSDRARRGKGGQLHSVADFLADIGPLGNGETARMETEQESSGNNATEWEDDVVDDEEGDGESFAEACELYAGAVSSNAVGFFRVGETLCVVEGWDRVKGAGTEMRSTASYLPIRPPEWAGLPDDSFLYPYPVPVRGSPGVLRLDKTAACPCHQNRVLFKEEMAIFQQPCVVYTLVGAFDAILEVAECPECTGKRRRNIGPDLRELGLFNFNNHSIFSHELLEDFVNAFTTSETPIFSPGAPFIGYKTFVAAWFGHAELLAFEGDMTCSACGLHPDSLVCDSVMSAFPEKHRLKTLAPPTVIRPGCEVRKLVKVQPKVQFFLDRVFRSTMRGVIDGAKENAGDLVKAVNLERTVELYERLLALAPPVAKLFKSSVLDVNAALEEDSKAAKERGRICKEFLLNLAAEESVLQMIL